MRIFMYRHQFNILIILHVTSFSAILKTLFNVKFNRMRNEMWNNENFLIQPGL